MTPRYSRSTLGFEGAEDVFLEVSPSLSLEYFSFGDFRSLYTDSCFGDHSGCYIHGSVLDLGTIRMATIRLLCLWSIC